MSLKSHREDVPVFKIPFSSDASRTTWPEPQNQTFAFSRLHLFHFFVTRRANLIAQDTQTQQEGGARPSGVKWLETKTN